MSRIFSVIVLVALFSGMFFTFPNDIFAQANQASPNDTKTLTQQLQELRELVNALKSQIEEFHLKLETTQKELAVVKSEIQFTKFLSRGISGNEVTQLQEMLKQDPEIYPEGLVTGFFGSATEAAVRKFQEKHGIESLGIIGPKTRSKLNELITKGAGEKIIVCHIPPGEPSNKQTIEIGESALDAHLAHGDTIGACVSPLPPPPPSATTKPPTPPPPAGGLPPPSTATTTEATPPPLPPPPPSSTSTSTTTVTETAPPPPPPPPPPPSTTTSLLPPPPPPPPPPPSSTTTPPPPSSTPPPPSPSTTTSPPLPPPAPSIITHICGTPINVPKDTSSIQTAINSACSGDTIYVAAGRYDENITVTKSRITLKGASGTKPEQVIIDGGGRSDVIYVKGAAADFVIDGFTLQNASQSGSWPNGAGLSINFSTLVGGDNNAGNTIARNLVVMKNSFGIYIASVRSGSVTIERSVVSHNLYRGIDASSVIFSGQVIMTNNTIANNSVNGYYDWAGGGSRTFRNNIITNNGSYGIYSHKDTSKTISYNDLWNNSQGNYCNADTYGNCITSSAPSPGTGQLSVDPLFVSPVDYNFNLKSGSPAINAGDPAIVDPDGSRSDMGVYPYLGSVPVADTTPPVISNIQATSITPFWVRVSWTTDENSDTQVQLGNSTNYDFNTSNSGLVTSHSSDVLYLQPGATYHFQVKSKDVAGNLAVSSDNIVTTPAVNESPVISGVQVTNVTSSNATFSWSTSKPANASINYSLTINPYGNYTYATPVVDTALTTSHSVTISQLQAGTNYYYRVNADFKDASGNWSKDIYLGQFSTATTTSAVSPGYNLALVLKSLSQMLETLEKLLK